MLSLVDLEHGLARVKDVAAEQSSRFQLGQDAVHGGQPYVRALFEQAPVHILGRQMP